MRLGWRVRHCLVALSLLSSTACGDDGATSSDAGIADASDADGPDGRLDAAADARTTDGGNSPGPDASSTDASSPTDGGRTDAPIDAGPPFPDIAVYSITSDGAMGGRAGADALCDDALSEHPQLVEVRARAVLCVDGPYEAVDFPSTLGVPADRQVVSLDGARLAANWAGFMTSLDTSLSMAGVFEQPATGFVQFFTGCGPQDESLGCVHNCNGFTSASGGVSACVGRDDVTDETWIAWGNVLSCVSELPVLCIAYAE